jgi:hypothetical protein
LADGSIYVGSTTRWKHFLILEHKFLETDKIDGKISQGRGYFKIAIKNLKMYSKTTNIQVRTNAKK